MPASLADKTHLYQRIVKVKRALEMKGVRVDVRNGEDGTSPSSCYIYDAEEDEEVHVDEMMPSSVIWDAFGATPTASVAPGASVRINPLPTPNRSPAHGDEAPVPDDDIKILITSWRSQRMLRHAHEALDNISRHLARVPGPCRPLHIMLILKERQDMINELLIRLSNGELEREYQTALNLHFSLQKELESLQKELEVLQEKGEIGEQDKKCHDLKKRLDLLVHISKDGAQHLEQLTKRARDFRVILEDAVGALARTSRADQADIQHISQKVQVQQQPGMTASGPSASPASSESPSDTTQQQGGAGGSGDPPSQLENEYRKLMGLHFIRVTDEEERQLIEKHIKECHDAGRLDRLVGISQDVERHLDQLTKRARERHDVFARKLYVVCLRGLERKEREMLALRKEADAHMQQCLQNVQVEQQPVRSESPLNKTQQKETAQLCCECFERDRCVAFLPCRHLSVCQQCSDNLMAKPQSERVCPICRQETARALHTNIRLRAPYTHTHTIGGREVVCVPRFPSSSQCGLPFVLAGIPFWRCVSALPSMYILTYQPAYHTLAHGELGSICLPCLACIAWVRLSLCS